jgi:K(+)-stimulated pyrophosphate-energized sodium pump
MKKLKLFALAITGLFLPGSVFASEANLIIPDGMKDETILYWGFLVILFGFLFGLYQFLKVKKLPAHKAMLEIASVIYQTSKTYLIQQGKFLMILFI